MTGSRFGTVLASLAVFASLTVATARAQSPAPEAIPNHPALSDRFTFEIGGYFSRSSTQASLGPPAGGVGAVIDFENTLGLDERNLSGIAAFTWRITDRWRLDAEYFSLNRNAARQLDAQVTWGDKVFPIGTTVETKYDFSDIRVSGGYSFFKRRDKELGIGVGLHVAGIKASLQAAGVGAEAGDVLAPLPVLNLYGTFALTNEWAVRFRTDWLSLNYDVYSGDLRSTTIDVLYRPFRHVGFGLGARNFVLDVKIDDPDWRGRARTSFNGPTAFMTMSF
ncbi:MAG: hypothetical protein ACRET6_13145 [Burkholderiales bacterium]